MKKLSLFTVGVICLFPFSVFGNAPQSLGEFDDWSAYSYQEGKNLVCYMASTPQKSEGKYNKRGDIYAVITHRPGDKTFDVLNFVAGYTYKSGSTVTAKIGQASYTDFFVDGDKAWTMSSDADKKMVEAMKKGERLILEGTSAKGTLTKDYYSLKGFSAAYKAISAKCRR
ncbi:MAG: hypothetical protein IJ689_06970 [Alphaproteobacteria bacterium]|nr:hypothetical protein [Alphaproteobacteria bacterium]